MSLAEGLVSGWVPSYRDDDDNDVDINNFAYPIQVPDDFLSPSSPALTRTSSNDSYSHHSSFSSSSYFDQAPPSPGSSVDHTDVDPSSVPSLTSSDRRAIRNRMRDPEWVPRPRNAFIIFRCEYSRKHARDPSDHSDRCSRSDKSLSKRAGEEWRRLSAAEREHYKVLAEQEKVAHALQNPDYRFKPVRRPPPGVTASSAGRGGVGTFRRTDRSAQVASLIMRSERGASSITEDDHKPNAHPELPAIPVPTSAAVIGRRRSASMPQPVAAQMAVIPDKARTPVPISCMSSPGPSPLDFDMFSSSEMDDSPLYTPVLPTSPALHAQPSGFQMMPLPEHPSSLDETLECGIDVGGAPNSSAPAGAISGAYAYTDSSFGQHQQPTFTDDAYPALLQMTTPTTLFTDWVCAAAPPTESSLALAGATPSAAATHPKSPDTGAVGSFDPTTPLPIPFSLQQQHTTYEIAAAHLWSSGYAEAAAPFGGAPGLAADFAEPLPAARYDVTAAQAGLDEYINVL